MYRVPPSRRRRVFRSRKPWLATLLVLPTLVFNGMTIFEVLVTANSYGSETLAVTWLAAICVLWALAFVSVVVRDWPRWWALLFCFFIILIDLASIVGWAYLFVTI